MSTATPSQKETTICSSPAQIYNVIGGSAIKQLLTTRNMLRAAKKAGTNTKGVKQQLLDNYGISVEKRNKEDEDLSSSVISALRTYWTQRIDEKPSKLDKLRASIESSKAKLSSALEDEDDAAKQAKIESNLQAITEISDAVAVKFKDEEEEVEDYNHILPTLGRSSKSVSVDLSEVDDIMALLDV